MGSARTQKAARIERLRVHRRQSSVRPKRPVTPEVAGSSPVAPAEHILQTDIFCCLVRRIRPPAAFHPAVIPREIQKWRFCRYFLLADELRRGCHPARALLWDGIAAPEEHAKLLDAARSAQTRRRRGRRWSVRSANRSASAMREWIMPPLGQDHRLVAATAARSPRRSSPTRPARAGSGRPRSGRRSARRSWARRQGHGG